MKTGFVKIGFDKIRLVAAGLLLATSAVAATPTDYASQWTLRTDAVGAYTVVLDEGIYRQVTRADLSDLAAFNADGEELAFGPLPSAYKPPSRKWHDAVWFVLPAQPVNAPNAGDLQFHVTRGADGTLSLDSTLSGAVSNESRTGTQDLLIDVRAKDHLIEELYFDFIDNAPDFSASIEVEASDDLKNWHPIVSNAPLAFFRQHGAYLLLRTVEFDAQSATYLRVHASMPLPILAVHQLQRDPGIESARSTLDAAFVRGDGNDFIYRLPARVVVERLSIALADDNTAAHLRVSAREQGATDWRVVGAHTAFRLRGTGIALDAGSMDVDRSRFGEWRIESDTNIAKPPRLRVDYRPESWVVLTHGRAPYVIVTGSRRAQRGTFPIDALIGQLRARDGADWRPPMIGFGPMQASAGEAALRGWNANDRRTWILWGLLLLGAAAVIAMVWRLLCGPG